MGLRLNGAEHCVPAIIGVVEARRAGTIHSGLSCGSLRGITPFARGAGLAGPRLVRLACLNEDNRMQPARLAHYARLRETRLPRHSGCITVPVAVAREPRR